MLNGTFACNLRFSKSLWCTCVLLFLTNEFWHWNRCCPVNSLILLYFPAMLLLQIHSVRGKCSSMLTPLSCLSSSPPLAAFQVVVDSILHHATVTWGWTDFNRQQSSSFYHGCWSGRRCASLHTDLSLHKQKASAPPISLLWLERCFIWLYSFACKTPSFA